MHGDDYFVVHASIQNKPVNTTQNLILDKTLAPLNPEFPIENGIQRSRDQKPEPMAKAL
ncbi:hypothetical protein RvY_10946 [Ramazzottius varieornatus]|uniref:Uncharacterized protein n=1 Tax=Ramazzottius varieornatus TaxID=947166 RepID=A0A1D1VIV6_RAMVA|nr:hypothetical protein RvY_10946 [Ramazzottius varieornatus]